MGFLATALAGKQFGRLTVIERVPSVRSHARWRCRCECGNFHEVDAQHLKSGHSRSCGCLLGKTAPNVNVKHGHNRQHKPSPTYRSWAAMLARCRNVNSKVWSDYGGRGIRVCERWLKFENFLADMGERPLKGTVERKDNNGNYEPGNCRWITQAEQLLNTRRTRYVEWNGETKPLHQWCKIFGLDLERTRKRLDYAPPAEVFAPTDSR